MLEFAPSIFGRLACSPARTVSMMLSSRLWPIVVSLSILVLALDIVTGPYILFPIAFVVPVAIAAWYRGKWSGIACGAFLVAGRFGIVMLWEVPEYSVAIRAINAAIRLSVLVALAWMTDRLARQSRELARRVVTLEGLLPICGHCKQIRDDAGQWQPIERYVSARSAAKFSHGICDPCFREHFPEVYAGRAARELPLAAVAPR